MKNQLRALRLCLDVIRNHLPGYDAKFTMRAAELLIFLLEREVEPASYPAIKQHTGITQNKASDMATKLVAYGVVVKTVDSEGLVAYAPSEAGKALRDALNKRLGGSEHESP